MSEEPVVDERVLRCVEALLMAADAPLSIERMYLLLEDADAPDRKTLRTALQALVAECEGRAAELVEVASGWRYQVRSDYAGLIGKLWEEKPTRLTRALLETLALIVYRQPISRGEIEEVRGVAVSSNIIKTLLEREWVRVMGYREVPGRPALFGTTRQFLDDFNLKSLEQLPTLPELRDLDQLDEAMARLRRESAPADEETRIMEGDNDRGDDDSVAAPVDGENNYPAQRAAEAQPDAAAQHDDEPSGPVH